jgi:putative membrane protein
MRNTRDYVLLYLKGVSMGGADVIPGVSGGTIAFITGIYQELLESIKSFDKTALSLLFRFDLNGLWRHVNGSFLLVLLAGIGTSIITLAKLIHYLINNEPIPLWSFFFGLIVISSLQVAREIKQWKIAVVVAGIAGIAVAYFVTSATPATTPDGYLFIFFSGMIAICAMILPGISGSFILLIMGKYEYIIGAVKDLNVVVLVVFGAGCITGILGFSHIVSWFLRKYHDITVAVLAGFMVGSLNKIWPWKEVLETRLNSKGEVVPLVERNMLPNEYIQKIGDPHMLQALLFFGIGILLIILIEKIANAYGK